MAGTSRTAGREQSRSRRNRGAAVEADAIGEKQTKRTPSGSRVEVDAIRELQPKRTQLGSSWNGRNRKQQLKRIQAGSSAAVETDRCNRVGSSSWSGRNRGAAALHRELSGTGLLTYIGERRGSSWASEATCMCYTFHWWVVWLYTEIESNIHTFTFMQIQSWTEKTNCQSLMR